MMKPPWRIQAKGVLSFFEILHCVQNDKGEHSE